MVRRLFSTLLLLTSMQTLVAQDFPLPGLVISDGVRIRSRPSLSASVLTKVDHGTVLKAIGKSDASMALTENGEFNWWYHVEIGATATGWIYGAFLYLEAQGNAQNGLTFKILVSCKQELT